MPFMVPAKNITLALHGSATSAGSTNITFPAGIEANDLIVVYQYNWDLGSTPTAVTPSGFTNVVSDSSGLARMILSWKKATGSESGSLAGMSGSDDRAIKLMYVFRGGSSYTANDIDSELTDSDPASQTILSGSGSTPLVAIATYGSLSSGTSFTFSPSEDGSISDTDVNADVHMAYKIYNESPSNITADMADLGASNHVASLYFEAS